MQSMRWDDLSVLLAVSRSASMSEAARRLQVDQTTISRRLRAFEDDAGVQLVIRRRDGIALTEAGRRAARAAEVMETVTHDLERELFGADARLEGRLRVTTLTEIALEHPELFTSFATAFPGIDLEVETGTGVRSLARREADVALRWHRRPDPSLYAEKLFRVAFAVYARRDSVDPDVPLREQPWLATTRDTAVPALVAYLDAHAASERMVCRYEDLPSLVAAVRTGAGVAVLPCGFADADPSLVRLSDVLSDFAIDAWFVTHPDLRDTARVRSFLAHVRRYFSSRTALYAG